MDFKAKKRKEIGTTSMTESICKTECNVCYLRNSS